MAKPKDVDNPSRNPNIDPELEVDDYLIPETQQPNGVGRLINDDGIFDVTSEEVAFNLEDQEDYSAEEAAMHVEESN